MAEVEGGRYIREEMVHNTLKRKVHNILNREAQLGRRESGDM